MDKFLFEILLKIVSRWKADVEFPDETYAKGEIKWMKIVFKKENPKLRDVILDQLGNLRRTSRIDK